MHEPSPTPSPTPTPTPTPNPSPTPSPSPSPPNRGDTDAYNMHSCARAAVTARRLAVLSATGSRSIGLEDAHSAPCWRSLPRAIPSLVCSHPTARGCLSARNGSASRYPSPLLRGRTLSVCIRPPKDVPLGGFSGGENLGSYSRFALRLALPAPPPPHHLPRHPRRSIPPVRA